MDINSCHDKDYLFKRNLLEIALKIQNNVSSGMDCMEIWEEADYALYELINNTFSNNRSSIKSALKRTMDGIDKQIREKKIVTGIPSGFPKLDDYTAGFQPSDLIVFSGSPAVGKTSFALSILYQITFQKKIPAAFFSLDMSDTALIKRMLALYGDVDSKYLNAGCLTSENFCQIQKTADKMYDAPLYIIDKPTINLCDIRVESRRLKAKEKIEIIFIDYLNLLVFEKNNFETYRHFIKVSKYLKNLACELNIPIVVLYRSDWQTNTGNRNILGGFERYSDTVIFLKKRKNSEKIKLCVAKERNGLIGKIEVDLHGI